MTVTFYVTEGAEIFNAEMDSIPWNTSTVNINGVLYLVTDVTYKFTATGRGGTYDQEVAIKVERK